MNNADSVTVSEYLAEINSALASHPGRVRGEVIEVSPASSGIFFTLKDGEQQALLKCVIWKGVYARNGVELNIGDEVIVTGSPDIYPQYGRFTFKVNTIEYAGEGILKREYEKLKATLEAEGLFDPSRKRNLPPFPKRIGVITSLKGVVIQDFSSHLAHHGFKVSTVDSRVEGKDAIHELMAALRTMSKEDIDVLVVIRGGGSMESLQAFNTESVVRALAAFKVPTITGIGHDVDVTLCEMVADLGQSTPTAAAKSLSEPWVRLETIILDLERNTVGAYKTWIDSVDRGINANSKNTLHVFERQLSILRYMQSEQAREIRNIYTSLGDRVRSANKTLIRANGIMRAQIKAVSKRIHNHSSNASNGMLVLMRSTNRQILTNSHNIIALQNDTIRRTRKLIEPIEANIRSNDPKRNMKLGYSLSFAGGKLVRTTDQVSVGDKIITSISDGYISSKIRKVGKSNG